MTVFFKYRTPFSERRTEENSMTTPDGELPEDIESRLDTANFDKELTQKHVALEFVHGDRPFYNVTKMHAALGSDVSSDTVRARMDELHERDILERRKINNGKIYWLRSEDSNWPIPPDVEVEPERTEPTVTEWRQEPHIQISAGSVFLAVLGTAVVLVGTFQTGGYYQLPFSATDIVAAGLSLGIFSYIGFLLAGVAWVFRRPDLNDVSLSDFR